MFALSVWVFFLPEAHLSPVCFNWRGLRLDPLSSVLSYMVEVTLERLLQDTHSLIVSN